MSSSSFPAVLVFPFSSSSFLFQFISTSLILLLSPSPVCFPSPYFRSSPLHLQLAASPSLLLHPYQYSSHWLQGFPTCIYRVFIGSEPCFLSAYQQPRCAPPTNFPDTALGFQNTTGPGCSRNLDAFPPLLSFSGFHSSLPSPLICTLPVHVCVHFTTQLLIFWCFNILS